jgi:protein translocase SecG subunit
MELTLLGAISFWKHFLVVVFIIVSILLIVLVLLQKGRGGGLASAFGGAGGQSAFGSKTGDAFTKITIGFVAIFLVLAVVVSKYYKPVSTIQDAAPQQRSQPLAPAPIEQNLPVSDFAPASSPEDN